MVGLGPDVVHRKLLIFESTKKTCRKLKNNKVTGDSMLCCGRRKDQGRDIPPNAEPAASPRRLQLGQLASTLQPGGRGVGGTAATNKDFPHMVLQPDFRKVSGISTEIFRQLESVENDHDATTAAALGAVERRGEMLVRILDPGRQFSRPVQDTVRKFIQMQDALHTVHFVEIVKRPGQTLGLYIREGNGLDRYDGVFISRIAIESAVFNSGCLGVGDEILAVNLVDVTHMSLDDVVILMSIPRRLVLTIRQRKGQRIMSQSSTTLRSESKLPPVVVIKKELGQDEEMFEDSNDENGHAMTGMGHHMHHQQQQHQQHQQQQQSQYYHHTGVVNHYANLRDPSGGQMHSLGRGRTTTMTTTTGQRLFSAPPGVRAMRQQDSIQSLPRHASYQPSYANLQLQHLPDVTDYSRISRHDDFRLETPQPPIRRPQYSDYYDQMRPEPPPRPSSQQGGYNLGPGGQQSSYDWYRSSSDRGGSMSDQQQQQQQQQQQHYHHPHHHSMVSSLPHDGPASISYQPPPPVITEQPRSIVPAHFQPFDRAYPKTLESLAEKVHTFYTGPRPLRHHGPPSRSSLRIPRTGSDHRLSISSRGVDQQAWYGSMPRQRSGDYRSLSLQQPLTPSSQQQQLSARYSSGISSRLSGLPTTRRKPVLDYASDSEAMVYTPSSMRSSTGLSLPASTRRSLGLSNGRSNSLPRDFIRGRGGRKHNVRFDKRGGISDHMSSSMAGHRAQLLLASSGLHSEDEGSDGAASAPEMPTPRRERGRIPSSPSVFTSAEYRAWLTRSGDFPFTRAPSTSAIYERLKTNRDSELLQTQRAAKFTYSAENLSLLDRARNRTERHIKILTDDFDRSNQSNLSLWEARLKTQDQPYYSYRSHLIQTGLTGGDSTIARALAGRSPSTSSALASLGIGHQSPLREVAKDQLTPSSSSDPLRRLGLTPSRSRDLISSFSTTGVTGSGLSGLTMSSMVDSSGVTGGRTTPTSLLHRMSDKETDSILRKELLSRSLLGRDHRDLLTRSSTDRDTLKEELEEKTEKISSRLSSVLTSSVGGSGLGSGIGSGLGSGLGSMLSNNIVSPSPASILSRTSGVTSVSHHQQLLQQQQQQQQQQPHVHHHHHHRSSSGGSGDGGSSAGGGGGGDSRLKLLTINPSEFLRYKIERPSSVSSVDGGGQALTNGGTTTGGIGPLGHSGILRVHLLAGRALRSTVRNTDSTVRTRDLYCVLECDRVHKARTVVCTGDQNFDWDEIFELDIVSNKELDFLIYSWDPQLRHRLCYKGSVNLIQILNDTPASAFHQLAIKVEPRGTLYVKLKHTPPQEAFKRELRSVNLFGGDVANVVMKEDSGLNVPLIVQRCIEEIERRGLDIIGLYRLCGSATKKQTLREAFERSPRVVDLSAENVPDINVIAGVLKDYLRELPEPLLTQCLYQMLVDALGVCLPDDPEGNARLLFSIIECLPKPNRCTLLLILEHLSLVCSLSDRNKMGPTQLAGSFGPILMVHYDGSPESLDFQPPIKVLQYLLEVWPAKSVRGEVGVGAAVAMATPATMPSKPLRPASGRPFPRSSPASILSSHRSQKAPLSMILSPSKQSPGSLSESSPSPTSIHSTIASSKLHHPSSASGSSGLGSGAVSSALALSSGTTSSSIGHHHHHMNATVTSSSSGVLTSIMSPSTTSSSLTSVTTPNSLTPVSSTAKSIAPTTTSSNYSLTSEFSTTSVTSPTPGMKPSDTNEELFTSVSVRSRVSAFEQSSSSTATPAGNVLEEVSTVTITTTATATSKMNLPPQPPSSNGFKEPDEFQQLSSSCIVGSGVVPSSTQQVKQPPAIPPSPFPGRKFVGGPGRAERADSLEEKDSLSTKRKLPPLPQGFQGFAHPDLPPPTSTKQYSIPPSSTSSSSSSTAAYAQNNQSQVVESGQPKVFGQVKDSPQASHFYSQRQQNQRQHQQEQQKQQEQEQRRQRRQELEEDEEEEEEEEEEEDEEDYSMLTSARFQMDSPFTNIISSASPPSSSSAAAMISSSITNTITATNGEASYKPSKPINVPPPPPPKPGMASRERARRDRELENQTQSRSQSQSEEESPPDDSRRGSTGTVIGPGVSTSDVTSSSSTPTTVQSQGSNSKGSSPGPATPATPPPVPPRLDRRPSQTSPTSSPPSIPPPVPPRLGRAAPVRTPSLDGREAFEVDCYTIKEENGEEDYLT